MNIPDEFIILDYGALIDEEDQKIELAEIREKEKEIKEEERAKKTTAKF